MGRNDPDGQDNFDEYNLTVTVSDSKLTVQPATGASNAKAYFLEITESGSEGVASPFWSLS